MKKNRDVKKITVISVIVVIFLIIAAVVCCLLFLKPENDKTISSGEYYPANYEEDIFLNQAYMDFQRDMLYGVGGLEQLYSYDADYDAAEPECKFFLKYFNTVIHGDYEKYRDFFVEGYFEEEPKFTMQMIYDPYVRFHSVSEDELNGEKIELLNFQVGYRIFKNNKTFRPEVSSNVLIPQIYQLIKLEDGTYRIFNILEIEVKNAD